MKNITPEDALACSLAAKGEQLPAKVFKGELTPKEEFDLYSNIARNAVSKLNDEKNKNKTSETDLLRKTVYIFRAVKETAENNSPNKREIIEGLFMLLEKTLGEIRASYSKIINELNEAKKEVFIVKYANSEAAKIDANNESLKEYDRQRNEEFLKKLEEENKAKLDEEAKARSETPSKGEVKPKKATRQRKTAKGKKA